MPDHEEDDSNDGLDFLIMALSNVLLFLMIFGLSATVETKHLKHQLGNKFAIFCGVAMQFIIMPLLGFVSVMSLKDQGLTQAMGVTLLVVTSSPGGSYSNWWCSTFNAELALSVAMTTISSVLSIGMLPGNLLLYSYLAYGTSEDESIIDALNFKTLFVSLGIVLVAITIGLLCGAIWDSPNGRCHSKSHDRANKLGSLSGLCLILFGLVVMQISDDDGTSGDSADGTSPTDYPWAFYVGVMFPCVVGIVLANIISRSLSLSPPETVAISIECCYQNTAIATSVAITMFDNATERTNALAVPLLYGAVEALVIGLYCLWAWKAGWTKAPASENFWAVISQSYQGNASLEPSTEEGSGDGENDDAVNEQQERVESQTKAQIYWRGSVLCVK